jgi:ApaG protein
MSDTVTKGLRIVAQPRYLPEQSNPAEGRYLFAYDIAISNHATRSLRVVSRHWIITDGNGHVEHVRGPGVVGQQPRLAPGESFRYTSACPLPTPVGTMHGSFRVEPDDAADEPFDAQIRPFRLAVPGRLN